MTNVFLIYFSQVIKLVTSETASTKVNNDIHAVKDKRQYIILKLPDLSTAFNAAAHSLHLIGIILLYSGVFCFPKCTCRAQGKDHTASPSKCVVELPQAGESKYNRAGKKGKVEPTITFQPIGCINIDKDKKFSALNLLSID